MDCEFEILTQVRRFLGFVLFFQAHIYFSSFNIYLIEDYALLFFFSFLLDFSLILKII